jgi:hypothetical protein
MKLNNYSEFINESFFRKLKSRKKSKILDKVENCKNEIIKFLEDNNIFNWNDFERMTSFQRNVVNKIIDKEVDTMKELKEVKFQIRLELSNPFQLRNYLKELEAQEEYEKCAKILQKIR